MENKIFYNGIIHSGSAKNSSDFIIYGLLILKFLIILSS